MGIICNRTWIHSKSWCNYNIIKVELRKGVEIFKLSETKFNCIPFFASTFIFLSL